MSSGVFSLVHAVWEQAVCVCVCEKFATLILMISSIFWNKLQAEFLYKSWRKFSQGSLNARTDESLVEREAAATWRLQRIGGVYAYCTFNTSCVDQVPLMSTLWGLLRSQFSLCIYFCLSKTFVSRLICSHNGPNSFVGACGKSFSFFLIMYSIKVIRKGSAVYLSVEVFW